VIDLPRNSDVDADGGSMAAGMSALKRIPDSGQTSRHLRKVPIVLQKSFCLTDHKFSGL
jgi:hypothetical protein